MLGRATFEARATKYRGISHERVLLRHKIKFQWEEGDNRLWVPIVPSHNITTVIRRVGDFALVSYRQRYDVIKYGRSKARAGNYNKYMTRLCSHLPQANNGTMHDTECFFV